MKPHPCTTQPDPAYKSFAGVYVDRYQVKDGWRIRYRLKVNGKPKTLSGHPGDPEFAASHAELVALCLPAAPVGRPSAARVRFGNGDHSTWTLDQLREAFFKAPGYNDLKSDDQRVQMRRHLVGLCDHVNPRGHRLGDSPFQEIISADINLWLAGVVPVKRGKHGGKSVKAAAIKSAHRLFRFAIDGELTRLANPCAKLKRENRYRPVGAYAMSTADLAAWRRGYPVGTVERLTVELGWRTGLRASDLVRLCPAMVGTDGVLRLVEEKNSESEITGDRAPKAKRYSFDLAADPELRAIIDKTTTGADNVANLKTRPWLIHCRGGAFDTGYFSTWFGEKARDVGCDRLCTAHSMRAGSAVEMFRATNGNLAAVSAHLNHDHLSTTEIYLRHHKRDQAAEQGRAALRGGAKVRRLGKGVA